MKEMEDFLKTIIREAGAIAEPLFDKGVTHQTKTNLNDLLTEADVSVSDYLVSKIHEKYPDHHIHSEERDEDINPGAEFEWIIDPIDGTRNFARGVPLWCIIIAVVQKGETILAAVYTPKANELFFAKLGSGATMNDMPISVGDKNTMDYLAGSFGRYPEEHPHYGSHIARFKEYAKILNCETNAWIHATGCMMPVCYVASGGFDFFIQNGGMDHDYVGPMLIAREAGAVVLNSDGEKWERGRQDVIVANPVLAEKFLELFSKVTV